MFKIIFCLTYKLWARMTRLPGWPNSAGDNLPPRWVRSWCVLSFVGEAINHLLGGKSGDGRAAELAGRTGVDVPPLIEGEVFSTECSILNG